jgi:uncharacterized membrane protein
MGFFKTDHNAPIPPHYQRVIFVILPLMYFAGLVGLQVAVLIPYFKLLVPFNLVASLVLLLLFHVQWNRSFVYYCLIAFGLGFLVEVVGVATGVIFGQYQYGATLGWKVWNVPLTIGVNWLILNYCANVVAEKTSAHFVVKAVLSAVLMTALDVFVEPVAVRLDFWSWVGDIIPARNYVGWFVTAFFMSLLFQKLVFSKQNQLAPLLLLLQFLFFLLHNLLYMW